MLSERTNKIYKKILDSGKEGKISHFEFDYNNAGLTMYNNCPTWEKIARSMAYAISNQDIWVYEYDQIGGRIFYNNEIVVDAYCEDFNYYKKLNKILKEIIPDYEELQNNHLIAENLVGHITWNFNDILSLGVIGLKEKYLAALKSTNDEESQHFYQGVIIMLDALLQFNDKHIEYYKNIGNYELAERMKKVPRYPCETFKEAVQAFYMQHLVVMRENPYGGNSPGRLDYYLWPYLKKDIEQGRCSLIEARKIIDELFLRFEERLYNMDMWTEAIVVGGTNKDKSSSVNPLTYIMVESIMELNIIHPAIYIRIPHNPPEELLEICSKYLVSGNNRAQILNDNSIINSLVNNGIPYDDAVEYACGGCMEIGIQGKQSDLLYAGWQNVPKLLELVINGGICLKTGVKQNCIKKDKGLINYNDFDSFYSDFIYEADRITKLSLFQQDVFSEILEENRPAFLISSMLDNCFEKGRNMHAGGVKYHDYGGTHIGLPNVIDGLYAIKYAIFEKKLCSSKELIEALKANFKGFEKLQIKLKNIPKYGNDIEEVDNFAIKVIKDFSNMYLNYKTRHNGKGNPIILTFIHSPAVAASLGATPDGRNANSGIAQGITPHYTSMKEGITAAINSCCKMPFEKLSGGASSMWDFDSTWASFDLIKAIIKTFINKNGQIFQGNTTSLEELIDAKKNPEKYEHIIVRVGGYSAKFVNLWPELQDEIMNRMRHNH